jgi:Lar family restriction alleviation protein
MTNKEIKLKPCPFCSGTPDIELATLSNLIFVVCTKCGSCGSLHNTERKAVNAWNKRIEGRVCK